MSTTARVCEHQTIHINCGSALIQVTHALYGKVSTAYCGGGRTDCRASSSFSVAYNYCNGRSSCSVQGSNGIFGDPCPGQYKYLEISYNCYSKSISLSLSFIANFCIIKIIKTQGSSVTKIWERDEANIIKGPPWLFIKKLDFLARPGKTLFIFIWR